MTKTPYRFGQTFIKNHMPKVTQAKRWVPIKFDGKRIVQKALKQRHNGYQALAFMKGINK
jgi:hypothetical protein